MRLYRVSADTSEKEKVIGGILTGAQGFWLALGLVIAMALTYLLARIMPAILAIILGLAVGGGISIPFAFVKVRMMPLLTYLKMKVRFSRQSKYMINTLRYRQGMKEE